MVKFYENSFSYEWVFCFLGLWLIADLWGNSYQWPAVTLAYFLRYPKFVLLASYLSSEC